MIRLLGSPHVVGPGGAMHRLERRDAALLAMLALDGAVTRAHAAALVWADADPAHAASSLRQRLFRLRRTVGAELVHAERVLRLVPHVSVDLAGLHEDLAADALAARGELLGGLDYRDVEPLDAWIGHARQRWRDRRLQALAAFASELESKGELAAALPYAQRIVEDEPLLEHGHRRLMRLHYLRADRSAALAAFDRCTQVLGQELGLRPGTETRELARLIESGGALQDAAVPARAPRPPAVLRPPRLVGRDAEWLALAAAVDAGHGALRVLGEAGIGKTRLLGDFAAARAGAVMAGARPGDARVPFALLARLLRELSRLHGAPQATPVRTELSRVLPEWGTPPAGPFEVLRLQHALRQALRGWAAAGVQLLVLDDLHFADSSTLELLPELSAADTAPIVWLLGSRDDEQPRELVDWLQRTDGEAPPTVALAALDAGAVRALLLSLALPGLDAEGWAPALHRRTGGNPLFLLQTLVVLCDGGAGELPAPGDALPLPGAVGALIERRLSQLPGPALKLARVAALAGQDFDASLAVRVLGQHPLEVADAWHELEAAAILRGEGFAHDLLYEATLRSVPEPISRLMHGEIARAMRADAAPARRAEHWWAAGEWASAAADFVAAAELLERAGQRVPEGALMERAVVAWGRAGDRGAQRRARIALARLRLELSALDEGHALVQALLDDANGAAEWLEALDVQADAQNMARDHAAAAATARSMMVLAGELGDAHAAFNAARKLSGALVSIGQAEEALALFEAQAGYAAAHPQDEDVQAWQYDRGYLLEAANRPLEALAAYDADIARELAAGQLWNAHWVLCNAVSSRHRLGATSEALRDADRALALRTQLGVPAPEAAIDDGQRGVCLRDAGRFGEAIEALEGAIPHLAGSQAGYWRMLLQDHLAQLWLTLGQPARAGPLLADMPAEATRTAQAHRHVFRALAEQWRPGRGRGLAQADQAVALSSEGVPRRMHYLAQLVRCPWLTPDAVEAVCAPLAEETARQHAAGFHLHATLRRAEAEAGRGEADQGLAHAREALAALQRHDAAYLPRPQALWIAARALAACGDADAARRAHRLARHWLLDVALPHVPVPFRDSFLNRQPIHAAVLAGHF